MVELVWDRCSKSSHGCREDLVTNMLSWRVREELEYIQPNPFQEKEPTWQSETHGFGVHPLQPQVEDATCKGR